MHKNDQERKKAMDQENQNTEVTTEETKETKDTNETKATGAENKQLAQEEKNTAKTFTEKEVEEMKAAWENEKVENERLSKLSKEERAAEEQKKKAAELEEREKVLLQKERAADVKDELLKNHIPSAFAGYFTNLSETKEEMTANIKEFGKAFREAVQEEVNKRIQGITMKTGDTGSEKASAGKGYAEKRNEVARPANNPWA